MKNIIFILNVFGYIWSIWLEIIIDKSQKMSTSNDLPLTNYYVSGYKLGTYINGILYHPIIG